MFDTLARIEITGRAFFITMAVSDTSTEAHAEAPVTTGFWALTLEV